MNASNGDNKTEHVTVEKERKIFSIFLFVSLFGKHTNKKIMKKKKKI